jgi:radical SAM protein with 4Fe4S-binding SPASM domain
MSELSLLAINLTQRCNMRCAHCYLDAGQLRDGGKDELTTREVQDILDAIVSRKWETMVVLTGGEPLLRADLEEIIAHGAKKGLSMVVGTNGMALTPQRVRSLKDAGIMGVGISLDSLDEVYHDRFRGVPGGWSKTMRGIETCRDLGLSFQLHFSITEDNATELPDMIEFARACGARVLNAFFLVCTGRGESMSDISPLRYERVLSQIVAAQKEFSDLIIRARCAPHFKRIAHQQDPDSMLNRISGQEADGCIAGTHYCRITPQGGVTACPYIPDEAGNIRRQDFLEIWDHAGDFLRLRFPELSGKCGQCEYSRLCGGCRARPVAFGKDLMDEDPLCVYVPQNTEVIEPLSNSEHREITWSTQAEQRLSRIPGFVRRLVRKRAEAYVAEIGESVVTIDHLATLSSRRFGGNVPKRPETIKGFLT